jgi:hypothetical protein
MAQNVPNNVDKMMFSTKPHINAKDNHYWPIATLSHRR